MIYEILKSSPVAQEGTDWDRLLTVVSVVSKTSKTALLGRIRTKEVAVPRNVLCYLARKLTGMSLPGIGAKLGRDHSTILYGAKRARVEIAAGDPFYKRLVRLAEREFEPRIYAPWTLEIVDPDPRGRVTTEGRAASPPGLRVTYRREDGTKFYAVLVMNESK